MERLVTSKTGSPAARKGELYLHSPYDPEREARRFVTSREFSRPPGLILILGEVLGYLGPLFKKAYPGSRVLSVFCSSFFYRHRIPSQGEEKIASWHPDSGESLGSVLSRTWKDEDIRDLQILEWEPALRAYPERMGQLLAETLQFSREALGSALTTGYFGRRWIKNSLRNYLSLREPRILRACSGPVLIAASGPGLAEVLPLIRRYRSRFSLWALPSATDFLLHQGLEPDLVILSDPGFYTAYHFQSLYRRPVPPREGPPILFPLTAFPLPGDSSFPPVIFHQGTALETRLFQEYGPGSFYYPSHGTVAGSAVQIGLRLSPGPVFIAGLDLAVHDCREHVRPNAFDTREEINTERLNPLESKKYRRMLDFYPQKLDGGYRSSSPLQTYAGWFAARRFPGLFRLAPSPVETGIPEAPRKIWEKLPANPPKLHFSSLPLPDPRVRAGALKKILKELEKELQGARGGAELSPLAREMTELISPLPPVRGPASGGEPDPDRGEHPEPGPGSDLSSGKEILPFFESLQPLVEAYL